MMADPSKFVRATTPVCGNPYFDEWERLRKKDEEQDDPMLKIDLHFMRNSCIWNWAFSIPNQESIDFLAALGPLVDPMAGTGYWAAMVNQAGGDMICGDLFPAASEMVDPSYGKWHHPIAYTNIEICDAPEFASRNSDRTLVLSWPPMPHQSVTLERAHIGHKTVDAYHKAGGERVVYIGEPGGCTGDPRLHEVLGVTSGCAGCDIENEEQTSIPQELHTCQYDRLFERESVMTLPRWPSISDSLSVYRRISVAT